MTLDSNALSISSFTPPTPASKRLLATIIPLPSDPAPINHSTSISLSFSNGGYEVFVDRLTYRDLTFHEDGSINLAVDKVPGFADPHGETSVAMYVWKGEKLLGEWPVGRY